MPSQEVLESFIALVERNAHVEAIERFYTDTASMQENLDPPRKGKDTLMAGEKAFLARWSMVESHCVRPIFCAGNQVVIRWLFEFTAPDGHKRRMEELAYQRWDGDRIAEERFYYDPKQTQP